MVLNTKLVLHGLNTEGFYHDIEPFLGLIYVFKDEHKMENRYKVVLIEQLFGVSTKLNIYVERIQ